MENNIELDEMMSTTIVTSTSVTPPPILTTSSSLIVVNNMKSSNKSSLSSSTSSLVSTNSSSTATTPLVFAPPPTPAATTQQQPTSAAALAAATPTTTIPLYQLSASNTQLPVSSFAESLVDGGSVMFSRLTRLGAVSSSSSLLSLPPPTTHVAATTLTTPSSHFINNALEVAIADNTNSSSSNRRECKSTSDESYTLELEEQSLIASAANKIAAARRSTGPTATAAAASPLVKGNKMYRLNNGQFGFNPRMRMLASTAVPPTTAYVNRLVKTGGLECLSGGGGSARKGVKRLNGQSKFFIDHLKKPSLSDYNHNRKLFFAVSNNDVKAVHDLLDSNMYDVNCQDDKQRTCLHIASSRGYIDIVRVLLEHGANPNVRDCVNNLPIHLAIIASHVSVVTVLLEAGTDIHSLDVHGKTVLHLAGTRLRWLLNDDNHKASPKLKFEAIMIMNMIKEYLRRKKTSTSDLDSLAHQLENSFNLEDINSLTKQLLNQFETLNISNSKGT